MGSSHQYTCKGCGYKAQVSGGRDIGMLAVVRTMFCNGCRELVDVLIGQCGLDGPTGDPDYDQDLGRCPECQGEDVVVWVDGDPCPRCKGTMAMGENFILWD
jgi:hypothetical protein